MVDDRQCEEEKENGKRGKHGQRNIQAAMELLPCTAAGALHKMLLVVLPHLRRDPGNVVTPASQNLANEGINTLAHTKRLKPDGLQWFCLRSQHHSIAKQRLTGTQGP